MKGKILVAGAGHGGLSCAANLAKSGFDVTVLEKQKRENLGYDWDDVFFIDCLDKAGFPKMNEKNYHHSYPLHCTSPNKKDWILQDFSGHDLDCSVDRKYLLRYMIS
ncbi:MAG: NAD(P)-binding protein, partial [Oscillospiraceae bacterium]|nr:NAD(P)-binding protein [Oscillospiraceae bacterium]